MSAHDSRHGLVVTTTSDAGTLPAAAITIGIGSLAEIPSTHEAAFQGYWNLLALSQAIYPREPEASVVSSRLGYGSQPWSKLMPFHFHVKKCRQARSAYNFQFR